MTEEIVEVGQLERQLLSGDTVYDRSGGADEDGETILYRASFQGMEDKFLRYQTAQWVVYSLLLLLAWGIGLFMLLYLPVRRYIIRRDFRSRQLYVTPHAIVYRVTKPVVFPCLGVLNKDKHILLPSVADIVIEQGYLQSLFGVYSIRIENARVRRPSSDDVQIHGIAHPTAFRKVLQRTSIALVTKLAAGVLPNHALNLNGQAVLSRISSLKSESFSWPLFANENVFGHHPIAWAGPNLGPNMPSQPTTPSSNVRHDSFYSQELVLQKLEEVGSSVKRVASLIEERHGQSTGNTVCARAQIP